MPTVGLFSATQDDEDKFHHYQHNFYWRSNRQGKNFGLYRTRVRDEQAWEMRDNVMLEGFTLFTDWLVVEERQRAGNSAYDRLIVKRAKWSGLPLTIRLM